MERTLFLNGTIAEESWFDDDITPALFKEELMAGSGNITVWINSPGGDCVAAAQIYNMLMDYPHDVTVKIDGIAASAASVIAMAGTKVLISPVGMMMVHNPATVAWGDSAEMQKAIEMLSSVKDSIINAYEIKTGLSRAKLSHLMDGNHSESRCVWVWRHRWNDGWHQHVGYNHWNIFCGIGSPVRFFQPAGEHRDPGVCGRHFTG